MPEHDIDQQKEDAAESWVSLGGGWLQLVGLPWRNGATSACGGGGLLGKTRWGRDQRETPIREIRGTRSELSLPRRRLIDSPTNQNPRASFSPSLTFATLFNPLRAREGVKRRTLRQLRLFNKFMKHSKLLTLMYTHNFI